MPMKYLHEKTQPLTRVPWCVADGMTAGPILLYRGIKPVLFVSIHMGMSAVIGKLSCTVIFN